MQPLHVHQREEVWVFSGPCCPQEKKSIHSKEGHATWLLDAAIDSCSNVNTNNNLSWSPVLPPTMSMGFIDVCCTPSCHFNAGCQAERKSIPNPKVAKGIFFFFSSGVAALRFLTPTNLSSPLIFSLQEALLFLRVLFPDLVCRHFIKNVFCGFIHSD